MWEFEGGSTPSLPPGFLDTGKSVSFQEIDFGVKGCIARLKWLKIGLSMHNSLETRLLDALSTHHVAVHWLASSTPMQACTSSMGRFYYWYWHLQ